MKQTYIKPEINAIVILEQSQILGSSQEITSGRYAGGDPTNPSSGPGISGEVGTDTDGSGNGYGQADPYNPVGGGNRAKSGMIWDEW